jgi:hypothetical protein
METSGPVQACNGTTFLYLTLLAIRHILYEDVHKVRSQVTIITALRGFKIQEAEGKDKIGYVHAVLLWRRK